MTMARNTLTSASNYVDFAEVCTAVKYVKEWKGNLGLCARRRADFGFKLVLKGLQGQRQK